VQALSNSLTELIRRHEILRTTFRVVNGQPIQEIHPPSALTLPIVDLCSLRKRNEKPKRCALPPNSIRWKQKEEIDHMNLPQNYKKEEGKYYHIEEGGEERYVGDCPAEEKLGYGNCHGYALYGEIDRNEICQLPSEFHNNWINCPKKEEEIAVYVTYGGLVAHSSRKAGGEDGAHYHKLFAAANKRGFVYVLDPDIKAKTDGLIKNYYLLPKQETNFMNWVNRIAPFDNVIGHLEDVIELFIEMSNHWLHKDEQGKAERREVWCTRKKVLEEMRKQYERAMEDCEEALNPVECRYQKEADIGNRLGTFCVKDITDDERQC
ncbi:hypothetical protein, partial [Moorena sp. SIO4A1]|uniref:hypothetical protein n=1 Tax=Moorena sp. SIO4A1 TaxID=2607835 RepID=UPI0025CF570B